MSVLSFWTAEKRICLAIRFLTADDYCSGCPDGLNADLAASSSGGDAFCAAADTGCDSVCPHAGSDLPERTRLVKQLDERCYSLPEQIGPG